ncbi:MAG TPA: alpha/beta fold hydrolase [Thermoguttaceae bacterium]|nr:alpha/beta fold hydrolase [Thermoguttaceae bacterium]
MKTRHVNGIELALADRGEGMPVVFVHGFPLDHTMWNAQIDALAGQYRVIAPDLRGFGRSGVTEAAVTMEQFADDLAALLDAMEVSEPIALCGLSMGGYIALAFQRKYKSRLRGLILCDTRAAGDTPEMVAARHEMADRVSAEGPAPLVDAMGPKLFARATVENRPEVVESLRRVMLSTDRRGIAAAARGMARRPDVTGGLSEIDCPTLVVVGESDVLSTPEEMSTIARAIPGARFVEIAESGHMSPMENPLEFNAALLDFLAAL